MGWRTWPTRAAFDQWHTAAKTALGLPRVGYNQDTGEPEPSEQWTTQYTAPFTVTAADVRAYVEDDVAELVPVGIGIPCDPPDRGPAP